MTLDQALSYIHSVTWRGSVPGLSRTRELLSKMGDPQNRLKFIHVAGTNGKGSTCAMLSSILQKAGYKTGLYTSPYINRFHERMQVNGEPISDDELCRITEFVRPLADAMEDVPTEFELVTCIGFEFFARRQCEIVVLECGMGGEFDSTNVIEVPECAVLCTIGMDHMQYLGHTHAEIAYASPILGCPRWMPSTVRRQTNASSPGSVRILAGCILWPTVSGVRRLILTALAGCICPCWGAISSATAPWCCTLSRSCVQRDGRSRMHRCAKLLPLWHGPAGSSCCTRSRM